MSKHTKKKGLEAFLKVERSRESTEAKQKRTTRNKERAVKANRMQNLKKRLHKAITKRKPGKDA